MLAKCFVSAKNQNWLFTLRKSEKSDRMLDKTNRGSFLLHVLLQAQKFCAARDSNLQTFVSRPHYQTEELLLTC